LKVKNSTNHLPQSLKTFQKAVVVNIHLNVINNSY
jgi:hypothetical protein